MITLEQAFYYLFILETENHELDNIKLNDLSITIFQEIIKPLSNYKLREELKRIIKTKIDFNKSEYEVKLDKSISVKIKSSLVGKVLSFKIKNTPHKIFITSITEKLKNVNLLNNEIEIEK